MVKDLPDYTRQITVLLKAEILSQMRRLPWWVRYSPSRILFVEDFEGVLKWVQEDGTVARVSDINVFEGTYAMKLTTAATKDEGAAADKDLSFQGFSKIALQLHWTVPSSVLANFQSAIFVISSANGTTRVTGAIRYLNYDTVERQKWQYYDVNGGWVDIPNGAQALAFYEARPHYLRLVIDPTEAVRTYIKLISDYSEIDLTTLPLYQIGSSAKPYTDISLEVYTNAAVAIDEYIDALLVSDQET